MKESNLKNKTNKEKNKQEFNIKVTFAKDGEGESFQDIVERIILRKMEEMK